MKIFEFHLLTVTVSIKIFLVFGFNLTSAIRTKNNGSRFYCYYAEDKCPNRDVQFWLYTNETEQNPLLLDPFNLTSELFPERLPLKILIHGLGLDRHRSPNTEVRPALLQYAQTYVISVDYSTIARNICFYPWALINSRVVAKCLASLLNNLVEMGVYTPEDFHVIGFSLGGQIAGMTANHMKYKLKRITGLDPAGPTFESKDLGERLDSSDAEFVDVIHTDPRFFSSSQAMGHVDFYPNYLHIIQPGCNPLTEINICNHLRSNVFYAESITTEVGFWSYNCGSYTEFVHNQCSNYSDIPPALMGYYVNESARGSYFLQTNSRPPYAQGSLLQVELSVADKTDSET